MAMILLFLVIRSVLLNIVISLLRLQVFFVQTYRLVIRLLTYGIWLRILVLCLLWVLLLLLRTRLCLVLLLLLLSRSFFSIRIRRWSVLGRCLFMVFLG